MLNGNLWHYLGSFVGYTLFAIALIYGAYWLLKKQPGNWLMAPAFKKGESGKDDDLLSVEANLTLEPHKNLYVVRAGKERFLLSTTMEQTQCLAKLTEEDEADCLPGVSVQAKFPDEPVQLPWFARETYGEPSPRISKPGLGARFVQSVQWLMESRKGK